MHFISGTFIVSFAVLMTVYYYLDDRNQNRLLLLANGVFYGLWDWRFLLVLLLMQLVNYAAVLKIDRVAGSKKKKVFIPVVCFNVGVLFVFKYFNFFMDNSNGLFHLLGISSISVLKIVVPVGISFYIFMLISYAADVYKRKIVPAPLLNFLAFTSFFPIILSGPIARGGDVLPQLERRRVFNVLQVKDGAWLFIWGVFKKAVLADQLARIVSQGFAGGDVITGGSAAISTLAYTFQIYLDFSSYSDMAIGAAGMLGIVIKPNFDLPYFARNPQDFWRRWHISLSTWIRDYIYIPLGGSRAGDTRTYVNIMVTMVLCGMWHGAGWNFILWGAYHGLLLCAFRPLSSFSERLKIRLPAVVAVAANFLFVAYGWMLFRAGSFSQITEFTKKMFSDLHFNSDNLLDLQAIAWIITPLILVQALQKFRNEMRFNRILPLWSRPAVLGAMLYFYFLVALSSAPQEFIYFQF